MLPPIKLQRFKDNFNVFRHIVYLYSDSIQMTIQYFNILTISGHIFANCTFIFHKAEVQTVILRCLIGLNLKF